MQISHRRTPAAGAAAAGPRQCRPAAPRAAVLLSRGRRARPRPPRAATGGDEQGSDTDGKKTNEYVEGLRKAGVDAAAARKILETWRTAAGSGGSSDNDADPAALRRLFLKQSAAPLLAVSAQVVIDATAAFFALNAGVLIDLGGAASGEPASLGRSAAAAAATILAGWFACGALIDAVTLGALIYALARLGASPGALLAAVKTIAAGSGAAGAAAGLGLADRAAAAVSAVRVTAALDAIAGLVRASTSPSSSSSSAGGSSSSRPDAAATLRDLSAFLVLQQAERRQGFDPAAYGITKAEAMSWALVFASADGNDDGALSAGELGALCARLGAELSPEDARAALAAIDRNGDGLVTFGEFAQWFAERRPQQRA
jgi:hypothetical protein